MRQLFLITALLFCTSLLARDVIPFNSEWRFARFGSMPDGSIKEEPKDIDDIDFDDSTWRLLNLPHDWAIEGPFRDDLANQTGKLPWAGIGWYRKTFQSPKSDAGKRIFIDFDGSMSGTEVWLNGAYVGEWPYGYTSFRFELTRYIRVGGENTIAVRLNNRDSSSRWYPGGGIYRHVNMVKTNPISIKHWGVFITTPEVNQDNATVRVSSEIDGEINGLTIKHEIYYKDTRVACSLERVTSADYKTNIDLPNPHLWDLDAPHLYQLKTTLFKDNEKIDKVYNTFGVRTIEYTAEGFFLNGKQTRMNGVCMHHDLGPLGAAVNVRAMERQIEISF